VVLAVDLSCHSRWLYAFDRVNEENAPNIVRIAIMMTLEMEIQRVWPVICGGDLMIY
jgi:hypothetical protein